VVIKSKRFNQLVAEAERQPFAGWDFSYVKDRMIEAPLPWDYVVEVLGRLSGVSALLDLGTGGGEVFSQLAPFPPRTFATEEYAPNAPIAARRLHPLGARVVRYEAPMENYAAPGPPRPNKPGLPFRDDAFDLVIDRHEAVSLDRGVQNLAPWRKIHDAAMRRNEFSRTQRSARGPTSVV
jgi:hypothetical protein